MMNFWGGFLAAAMITFMTGMLPILIFVFVSGQRDPLFYAVMLPATLVSYLAFVLWRHFQKSHHAASGDVVEAAAVTPFKKGWKQGLASSLGGKR